MNMNINGAELIFEERMAEKFSRPNEGSQTTLKKANKS